ncbi:MAG: TIR domain-containing protein, partial [Chloroflexi bacterium]
MTDVFISYSRKDTEFVRRLHGVLSQLGRDVWVDWEDIPRGVDWLNEIHAAIEAADTFILVISPDALASEICNDEIYHAFAHNKRIIPIIHREIDERAIAGEWFDKSWETQARDNWRGIKHLNWLFFRETDNFNGAVQTLLETIDTDIDHVQFHTRLLVRAREWEDRNRDEGFLLTGAEIAEARAWLAAAEHKSPPATALHRAYINRSHQTENVRQEQALRLERQAASRLRYLVGVLVVSLIVAIVLVIVSFTQFQNAQNEADSRATAQVDAESARAEINARLLLRSAQDAFRAGDVFLGIALALEAEPFDSVSELSRAVLSEIAVSPGPVAIFQDVDTGAVTSVALSPDRRLALASYADGRLRLWDVAQGIGTFTTPLFVSDVLDLDGINSVAFSADGQYAASAGCGVGNPDDNVCTAGQVILWQVVNEPQPTLQQVNMIGVLPEDNPESFAARTTSSEANAVVFDPDPRNAPIRLLAGYSSSSEGPFGILFVDEGETLRPREQIFNQD